MYLDEYFRIDKSESEECKLISKPFLVIRILPVNHAPTANTLSMPIIILIFPTESIKLIRMFINTLYIEQRIGSYARASNRQDSARYPSRRIPFETRSFATCVDLNPISDGRQTGSR